MKKWENNKYISDGDPQIFRDSLELFDEGMIYGQFACVKNNNDYTYEAVRDPLGIGKLFYCRDNSCNIHFSRHFADLFPYKSKIYSLPAGYKVKIDAEGLSKIRSLSPKITANPGLSAHVFETESESSAVLDFRTDFDSRLNLVFNGLCEKENEGWKVFIALSGGLDSTIIAQKAASFLKNPVACTLDLGKSEDSEKSIKIAGHIGIEHKTFKTSREDILDALEEAPSLCQDYRDFNVHCAALNILLARHISSLIQADPSIDPEKTIILTGDLMNEFTCDYAGEVIDGREYYKLPRVGKKQLQQFLISGLDTSDREVSPFAAYGLTCIQPFAILWDLYASLDESVLLHEDPKKLLNLFQVDGVIESFIPKVKLRAQVGSRENMGILGLCHSLGMDDKTFHANLLKKSGSPDGKVPLFVGRYDVEKMN
jgi:asparagine synthetase B (glutamine-hydrolysing)